jgi:hypothetical protein
MDVSMTHRNISRLTGNEVVDGKLVPAKEAITEADLTAKLSDNLEIEYEQLAKDLAEPDPYGAVDVPKAPWATDKNDKTHPFWDPDALMEDMAQDMTNKGASVDDVNDFLVDMYINNWDVDQYEMEVAQWMKDQG